MIKLQISTHSGEMDILEVENYDPNEIADKINSQDVNVIVIAKNIYSKIDIKHIKIIENDQHNN